MKRKRDKSLLELKETPNCSLCFHKEICHNINKLSPSQKISLDCKKYPIEINCKNYCYYKMNNYLLDDFKEILKERIDKTKNARHLLVIDSIFRL